jgi:hypothetical protein
MRSRYSPGGVAAGILKLIFWASSGVYSDGNIKKREGMQETNCMMAS